MAKTTAFDLKESQLKGTHAGIESFDDLAVWLTDEIESAQAARSGVDSDIRYAWALYEQQRTRSSPPWPGAADLTSPMAAEYVDALQARTMQSIFVDPVYAVEGWGEAAARAPFVEEFHQRMLEEERLQTYLDEVTQRALVEGVGILKVSESVEYRLERKTIRAAWQTDETGAPLMGEDMQPIIQRDAQGNPVEQVDPNLPSAEIETDVLEPIRVGPAYDVVPYLDQVTLPHHARHRTQVWGEAVRFYKRVPELAALAKRGIYDPEAVSDLGETDERSTQLQDVPHNPVVTDQRGPTAQKELYQVAFLADLDGKGERWWLAVVSVQHKRLLNLRVNDRTTRLIRFIPFPKPGCVDRGYSLIADKMRTVIEQDTAVRNMWADGAAMSLAAPIMKRQGALWDEYEQPWGPRAVITVRDMDEVQRMRVQDVPNSLDRWLGMTRADADRLVGQNDTSLGVDSGEDNTLGEERLRAGYVEIRVDLLIKRLKEPLEELGQLRHTIWKRTLAGAESLVPPVQRAMAGMSQKAVQAVMGLTPQGTEFSSIHDGKIVAAMLEGSFWFKPRGSVETADLQRQRQDWIGFLNVVPGLTQFNQMLGVILQTPEAAKSIIEQTLRVFRVPDKNAFLGPQAQQALDAAAQQQQMMQSPQMQMLMALAGGGQGAPGAPQPPPQGQPTAPPGPMA